jgi:hypothetical protein
MRIPDNPINPMAPFWYLVYALALFLIFVAGILEWVAGIQKSPRKNPIRKEKLEQKGNQTGPRNNQIINQKQLSD